MKRLGLRLKLTLGYTATFTVLLASLFVVFYYLLHNQLEDVATNELVERATGLRGYIRFENDRPVFSFDANDQEVAYFVRTATRYYQIYDLATGALIDQSPELELLGISLGPDELQSLAHGPALVDINTEQGRIRFFNDRIVSASGEAFFFQVGTSLDSLEITLHRFRQLILWLMPLGIVLAGTAGSLMAARVLAPIRNITRAAQEIELSQLSRRLPVKGTGDDLDRLAATFNEMFERLENAIGEMKQFTGSIAHELRTPLAAMRGETELALLKTQSSEEYRRVLSSQIEEFDKLSRMINQLLTQARAESGELKLARQPFDAVPMLRDLVETFSTIAAEKEVSLEFLAPVELMVDGDAEWLYRAVLNLLDNAVKYTGTGGHVTLMALQQENEALIAVEDSGCGIPADALPHIFERFYRADPSRGKQIEGVGLGLSLVKWIVDQHAGEIEVTSRVNQGTKFVIRIHSRHSGASEPA